MDTSKLVPNDPRVAWQTTTTRGYTYSYQVVEPECATPKDTILLVHGFPDTSFGWRNQAPYLASLGYRVVIPDMLGYGRTDAPEDPMEYTLKKVSDDIAAISAAVVGAGGRVILGGHDWGGALVWRVALWHPEIIKGMFVVCTPYMPPSNGTYYPLEALIANGILTNFGYQLQFAGEEVESRVSNGTTIRQFLRSMYGGTTPEGAAAFQNTVGIVWDKFMDVGDSPLVASGEMDYYVEEYVRHGGSMNGPLNWYRTRQRNFEDEVPLADQGKTKIDAPTLFVAATYDTALPPSMSEGMESNFTLPLQRGEVATSHWALEQAPAEVNAYIAGFLTTLENGPAKL